MDAAIVWIPYCGAAPVPAEIWARWTVDPAHIVLIVAAGILYAVGSVRPPICRLRFGAALALLLLLFVSPFCALTSALFSARVVHHVLLVSVAAALIVGAFAPRPVAERSTIAWSTAAQAIVFWLWHAPPVYAWALSNDSAYWLMQASLLASAGAFWAAVDAKCGA